MTSLNRVKERLDQLIAKGESVLRSEYGPKSYCPMLWIGRS